MARIKLLFVTAALLAISPVAQDKPSTTPSAGLAGRWDAVITNASKIDVPFRLSILQDRSAAGRMHASIVNGSERIPFSSAEWDGTSLKLHLEQYDGTLTVQSSANGLTGGWTRQTSKGVMHYPFRAKKHNGPEFKVAPKWKGQSLDGSWTFTFEGEGTDKIAPGRFDQGSVRAAQPGTVEVATEGTIAPVSGDYGLLAGTVVIKDGNPVSFDLSRFDGIHIVRMLGEFLPDGSIKGKLNTQSFTAFRGVSKPSQVVSANTEPDPESVTRLTNPDDRFHFSALDPRTGKRITQDDARFNGKAYIVDIFGTWCPNCHDEAPLLVDLYKRYSAQGLEIVGLAYEYVDEPARNARLLEIYRKKYGIEFPLLIAGTTDEGQIAKTLPQLVGFGAYPTTIFIGPDGKVQKIHAGFAGPATGDRFLDVKKRFEVNTRELLKIVQ